MCERILTKYNISVAIRIEDQWLISRRSFADGQPEVVERHSVSLETDVGKQLVL